MTSILSCSAWLVVLLAIFVPELLGAAETKPAKETLIVYTYDSFQSKWGPGPQLKEAFLKDCQCDLQFVTTNDAGTLFGRLKLEGSQTKADVVLGLDSTTSGEAKALGIFAPTPTEQKWALPVKVDDLDLFQPMDFGWYAFMFDTASPLKSKSPLNVPISLEHLLDERSLSRRVIIQDPRSSSVGLGLLLWMHARFGDQATPELRKLAKQVMLVGQGWSDSYSKFTKGEAPFVLSYTTSEAYHREEESSERYKALHFTDGHYLQVELAGLVKTSSRPALAGKFMKFLATPDAQRIIAHGNWMYPVVESVGGLPKAYDKLPLVLKSLYLPASKVSLHRKEWTDEWVKILSVK